MSVSTMLGRGLVLLRHGPRDLAQAARVEAPEHVGGDRAGEQDALGHQKRPAAADGAMVQARAVGQAQTVRGRQRRAAAHGNGHGGEGAFLGGAGHGGGGHGGRAHAAASRAASSGTKQPGGTPAPAT